MSIKAMKQALEALKWINDEQAIISYEAIIALRQAIAEAEKQEPVAWRYETGTFWDRTPHWRFLESADQTKGLRSVQALYPGPLMNNDAKEGESD